MAQRLGEVGHLLGANLSSHAWGAGIYPQSHNPRIADDHLGTTERYLLENGIDTELMLTQDLRHGKRIA